MKNKNQNKNQNKSIYIQLKLTRKEHNLKQKDIAKLLNITPQAYSLYETGKRKMPSEYMRILEKYFNVDKYALYDIFENGKLFELYGENAKNYEENDFFVIIYGNICPEAQKEINDFVAYIKNKYGYPRIEKK